MINNRCASIIFRPTLTNADKLCARVVAELRATRPRREIRLDASGNSLGWWDAELLERMVSNLVGHALRDGADGEAVMVTSRISPSEWTLSVSNGGPAIPAEIIVHQVVRAHGGTIEVASGADEGARFVVRLPRFID